MEKQWDKATFVLQNGEWVNTSNEAVNYSPTPVETENFYRYGYFVKEIDATTIEGYVERFDTDTLNRVYNYIISEYASN
jgi:hypothetical protein